MLPRFVSRLALLGALACAAWPAAAQWQWVDAQGKKVFSDTPPPPDVPPEKILRRPKEPSVQDGGGNATPTPSASPAAPTSAASRPGIDPGLEEQKRRAEAEEAAKQQAQQEHTAQLRQENCTRAQRSKATLTSGQLLSHTNEKGERGFMDEATRQAELQRIERIIASDCGG